MGGDEQHLGGTAIKPVGWDRTGMEAFRYMIYNPDTGEFLTRTPMSWVKIILFYCVYYSCLAAFWIACLQIFFMTLPEAEPRWTLEQSLIGKNPGVGVRPKSSDANIDSAIFYLDIKDKGRTPTNKDGEGDKNFDYATRMNLTLEQYENKTGLSDCPDNTETDKGRCIFDKSLLGECSESPYGYVRESERGLLEPCVFLKLNKLWGWSPEGVKVAELNTTKYDDMTDSLKEKIRAERDLTEKGHSKFVHMDCRGRFPADLEGMSVEYFPSNQGIPLKYFPFQGGNYHSPLVALKVTPKILGQLLHIECRAWFHGVDHDKKHKSGLTQFEVFVH